MKLRFSDLWQWDGTVDRGLYALVGVLGFAVKHNLDRFVASFLFHRRWGLFNYWIPPSKALRITALSREDARFLGTMLVIALPFIWVGVVLTLKRLRSAGLPPWLVVAFFLPVVNLAFFALLSLMPESPEAGLREAREAGRKQTWLDRLIPDNALGSAAVALLLTLLAGVALAALGVKAIAGYGLGVFVALPFCLGLVSVLVYGYHRPRSFGSCVLVSGLSVLLVGAGLVALAIEGVLCLIMALPIGVTLAIIGGSIGYVIQGRRRDSREISATTMLLLLMVPLVMGAEYVSPPEAPRVEVRTVLEIDAPQQEVWNHLISFPRLPAPGEWLFRMGVAYPLEATVEGRGAGAVRRCLFSTGTFVEPVDVWDEPRRLEFSVASQPPPMRELSPYDIHPRHLSGYLQPEHSRFVLTPLPGGRTRLEGTSWYQNRMWPAGYWQLWSDSILHHVHLLVFRHIQRLAEEALKKPPID